MLHALLDHAQNECEISVYRLSMGYKAIVTYPVGRLGFKDEGAGKLRVFAIPNALKQALLRPVHDWCIQVLRSIPQDGTFNQAAPLKQKACRH